MSPWIASGFSIVYATPLKLNFSAFNFTMPMPTPSNQSKYARPTILSPNASNFSLAALLIGGLTVIVPSHARSTAQNMKKGGVCRNVKLERNLAHVYLVRLLAVRI
jgi:hypothetical protein